MSDHIIPHLRFLPQEFVGEHLLGVASPFWDGRSAGSPPGKKAQLVSSVYGHMDYLMFFLPLPKRQNSFVLKCLKDTIYELIDRIGGQQRHFVVVTEVGKKEALAEHNLSSLERLAKKRGHQFYIIEIPYKDAELCIWTQDSFLPIQYYLPEENRTQIYLVEATKEQVRNKGAAKEMTFAQYSEAMERQDVTGLEQSVEVSSYDTNAVFPFDYALCGLPFAGGNVLAGDTFVIMGPHETSFDAIKKDQGAWLGQRLILLESPIITNEVFFRWTKQEHTEDNVLHQYGAKSLEQGIYHIDLFITLAGKNQAGEQQLIIGEPVLGFQLEDNCPKDIRDLIDAIMETSKSAINQMVASLERQLKGFNIPYIIKKTPLPLTYYDGVNKKKKQVRTWAWASYHNCLVEQYQKDGKTIAQVILPSYGTSSNYSQHVYAQLAPPVNCGDWSDLAYYDKIHYDFWESLGYEVVQLKADFNPFAEQAGSLNCISNCIQRTTNFH